MCGSVKFSKSVAKGEYVYAITRLKDADLIGRKFSVHKFVVDGRRFLVFVEDIDGPADGVVQLSSEFFTRLLINGLFLAEFGGGSSIPLKNSPAELESRLWCGGRDLNPGQRRGRPLS